MLRWYASMLCGLALFGWVVWIERAFPEDDEVRGFISRLAKPFALGVALLLFLNGVVRLIIAISNWLTTRRWLTPVHHLWKHQAMFERPFNLDLALGSRVSSL